MLLMHQGVKLAYDIYGSGSPTLVFLYGWVFGRELWHAQVAHFSPRFRVLILDTRGSGESDKPAQDYTMDLFVADLHFLMQELDLGRVVLVGSSMGSYIALKYAVAHPERVAKLVLVGATPKIIASPDFPHATPAEKAERWAALLAQDYGKGVKTFAGAALSDAPPLREWLCQMAHRTPLDIALNWLRHAWREDLRPLLHQITVPTLVMHGDADRIWPLAAGEYLSRHIPTCRGLHIFRGRGHAPFLTAPDEFNRALEEFVLSP